MTVSYVMEWGMDTALLTGGFTVFVSDDLPTATGQALITGTFCHTDMSSVLGASTYVSLGTSLTTEVDTVLNNITIAYTQANARYSITAVDGQTRFDFSTATVVSNGGINLAKALGFNYSHTAATGGSSSDPYNIVLTFEGTITSNVRPYYLVAPLVEGQSKVTDEYEPEQMVMDAVSDDGTAYYVAKDGSALHWDWVQNFETNTPPSTFNDPGMAVFKRSVTEAVPWSYQHAWEYLRIGGSLPFVVTDGSEQRVHQMRGEGGHFHPKRAAAEDYSLWLLEYRTRLLGRL